MFGCALKDRKSVEHAIIKIIKMIERQTSNKLKKLVCDGASEFIALNIN